MKHVNYTEVTAEDAGPGTKGAKIRWVITEKDGAPTFIMRHFEIAPGGFTPLHEHAWEHELFITGGTGAVFGGGKEEPFKTGDAIFIPGGEKHQFKNTGEKTVTMLCLIPARK
jgi:quercetin dioxygenase-like cupin family protein